MTGPPWLDPALVRATQRGDRISGKLELRPVAAVVERNVPLGWSGDEPTVTLLALRATGTSPGGPAGG